MFINFKCLLSMVLLFSFLMPVFSFEPSGGVLSLDGEDDYAILPFAEHGHISLKAPMRLLLKYGSIRKLNPSKKIETLFSLSKFPSGCWQERSVYSDKINFAVIVMYIFQETELMDLQDLISQSRRINGTI